MLEPDALRGARPDLRGESMYKHRFLPGISRVNAASRLLKQDQYSCLTYKDIIYIFRSQNIHLNRKTLSQFTLHEPTLFMRFCQMLCSDQNKIS